MAGGEFLISPFAVRLGLGLARLLPLGAGRWVGEQLGLIVARQRGSEKVRAVKANQWVVSGGTLSPAELEQRARAVYRANGRCLYDFYHHLQNPAGLRQLVDISPAFQACIERSRRGRSQFLLIPHFSNFDLVGRAAALAGLHMQVLSYAQPPAGYRLQNRLRKVEGTEITPISVDALRQALDRLRAGGTVLTAIDRPTPDPARTMDSRPSFFGRPADLPTGYLRIAMSARAPLVVIYGHTRTDGRYWLCASDPMDPPPAGADAGSIKRRAEEILEIVARLIRQSPEQWSMFYPVWPEAFSEIPA